MKPIRRVWVTRAEPGATRTADRLTALGFAPVVSPLLAIRPIPQAAPDLDGVTALAFTSRNGVAAFSALTGERRLPVFTVGDATAEAALAAGFSSVRSAAGALGDLASLLAAEASGPVLAPGALEPSGDLPALLAGRVEIRALPVYRAVETGAAAPAAFDAVLIHSPRGGRAVAALGRFAGQVAVAISEAAAAPLTATPGLAIRIAAHPDEAALFEALGKPAPRV
ncbi:uroporphyrinogen-III synthase [Roseibacterium beibuensis]|uniref:uroporphyrinogen-III synthase n=1 Tax=[Roseibacterium] beibuensis TaxID=1193142 RepID=UPI00217E6CC9|nr:uroporphyrinogen-III synthase [Roseibacterium beibuensis]MCS6626488.1 uroporphyrinogen-III synthase [Roseibacterium beibuensis]